MAFRGKEWVPANPKDVAGFIQDRLSLTELNPDVLKPILEQAIFDRRAQGAEDEGLVDEILDISRSYTNKLTDVNRDYYKAMRSMVADVNDKEKVNIVLPVYNSIHLAKECIEKVLSCTYWPYHLTIVDDASDEFTHAELEKLVLRCNFDQPRATLLTNKKNKGFSATVNRGLKHNQADYAYSVLLNSDVLVTPYWLSKMVAALKSNPKFQIVNPVTNNTALINVGMHAGFTYQNMNTLLEMTTSRRYPEIMPTGFCFLFPNSLLDRIGFLDEAYTNFGEETDFWMRTISFSDGVTFDQYKAVLADDTYVFHQRGASYESLSAEQHSGFRKLASSKFHSAWPTYPIWNKSIDLNTSVIPLRKTPAGKEVLDRVLKERGITSTPVCFVTHSVEACGGMHYIADIVNYINDNGGDARVAQIIRKEGKQAEAVAELRCGNYVFKSVDDFIETFPTRVFNNGIVIAATSELAGVVDSVCQNNPALVGVLHAQSYEPSLVNDAVEADKLRGNFFILPNTITNSKWITEKLEGSNVLATIHPGIDREVFYPSKSRDNGDERPTLLVSLNGGYPFKGAQRGVAVANAVLDIAKARNVDIRVMAYGVDNIQGTTPGIICLGKLPRTRIAQLLSTEADVFLDPATNHSYGMPALEAISCGVSVAGWNNTGIREYLPESSKTSDPIRPNDASIMEVANVIFTILTDKDIRDKIVTFQSKAVAQHQRQASVVAFDAALGKLRPRSKKLKICLVTPHLRKHGGPTTILTLGNELAKRGHEVVIATVYSDLNPGVIKYTDLPIILLNQKADRIPECDVLISNSDNPLNPAFVNACPQAKRKVMLKLSHNPRFQQLEEMGLQLKWDAIVTSSQWLADVCETPGNWNYPPVKATRIGWFHYNFEPMRRNIKRKRFHEIDAGEQITISTLIHHHPLKGSQEAGTIFEALRKEYGDRIQLVGVGEIDPKDVHIKLPGVKYVSSPSRQEMADLMFKTDIWLGCSKSEGLGRMALEAMTGGAACVLMDTGAEFVADNKNAMVIKIGDVNAGVQAVHHLIQDVPLRKQIAVNGYMTAKNLADPTDLMNKMEEVLFDLF